MAQPVDMESVAWVKLSAEGILVHRDYHNRLYRSFPDVPYLPPEVDADGWSQFPFWQLVVTFGHRYYPNPGAVPVFASKIWIRD